MTAGRTFIPELPHSWIAYWREHYYPAAIESLQPAPTGILDPLPSASPEAERLRRFGPTWSWWGLSPAERRVFEEMG